MFKFDFDASGFILPAGRSQAVSTTKALTESFDMQFLIQPGDFILADRNRRDSGNGPARYGTKGLLQNSLTTSCLPRYNP